MTNKTHTLPLLIMAAPNGARKTKADHPHLPITIEEIVAEARNCYAAGAAMLHAHIRNQDGEHSLDSGKYKELLAALKEGVPNMLCQITTEQVERFTPQDQARCLLEVQPNYASVAIREIIGDGTKKAIDYAMGILNEAQSCGVRLQYILYDLEDLELLRNLSESHMLNTPIDVLFVLGKYSSAQQSSLSDLDAFLAAERSFIRHWMVCAFGASEHEIMVKTASLGGQARIGFENNLYLRDGSLAPSTAALIQQLSATYQTMDSKTAHKIFAPDEVNQP